jgi:hypothetical protein
VAALDLMTPDALSALDRIVTGLSDHMDRENSGIFPVGVVTVVATGWGTVERAHERSRAPAWVMSD